MSLTFGTRNRQILALFAECMKIMEDKGPSYASSDEANANFYGIAKEIGIDTQKVWEIYFLKHSRSLLTYLNTGRQTSEGVQGNIKDMINYLAILSTMIDDNYGEGLVWKGRDFVFDDDKNQREQMAEIAKDNRKIEPPFVVGRGEQDAITPDPRPSSITEVTEPEEVKKLEEAMDSASSSEDYLAENPQMVTISQQRANHFFEFSNMDNFTPDFELAGVSPEAHQVNTG